MNIAMRSTLVQREIIIELLTDEEASKVATAETAIHLAEGDEFVDLLELELGVQRADGVQLHMASVLPRKALQEVTWGKILQILTRSGRSQRRVSLNRALGH